MPVQASWAAQLTWSWHTCFSCQEHRRELRATAASRCLWSSLSEQELICNWRNWERHLTQHWWSNVCFQKHSTEPQQCFGCTEPSRSQLQDATFLLLLHRKQIAVKKYLYLLQMSTVATFLPWRNYLQTYRKGTFYQENAENPDTKIEACHLSPGMELQQTHCWGQKALFPLWLCSDFNTWLQQLLSLP